MPLLSASASDIDPSHPLNAPSSSDGTAAECRLRDAEERLREAIQELQRHYFRRGGGGEADEHPDCDHADDSCVAHAIGNLCQSFLLSYGVRVGIGILLRAFKLAKRKSYSSILDLKFLESPARTSWRAVLGAVRSTTFLSAFVGIFQGVICLHRKVESKDNKFLYWVAGGISALSVLLEKKARRSELALYVLPRAGDSLWYILVNRHLLPNIKNAEVALFCLCMGGIMYYLEHEPDTMAPFLRSLIHRFLASRISNPSPPSNRNASYSYLQTLGAIETRKSKSSEDTGAASSAKYNLESIPGL